MSKLAQFIAASQEQPQPAATQSEQQAPPEPAPAGRLSQFVGSALRRVSQTGRRPSTTTSAPPAAQAAPASTSASSSAIQSLFDAHARDHEQPALLAAKAVLEWQDVLGNAEELAGKSEGKTASELLLSLAQQVVGLEASLLALRQQVVGEVESAAARATVVVGGRPPLPPSSSSSASAAPRTSALASPSTSPRHGALRPTNAIGGGGFEDAAERTEPIVMNKFQVPVDLSNEATVDIQDILDRVTQELNSRGGFEGQVYTFLKRKDGNMLNRDGLYVGGKIAAQFEFRCDADRKIKTFFISAKCRGTAEPVEDLVSKARDQSKYQLALDAEDDHLIVGCYKL